MCLPPYEFFVLTYLTFDNYLAISLYFSFTRRRVNFWVEVFSFTLKVVGPYELRLAQGKNLKPQIYRRVNNSLRN